MMSQFNYFCPLPWKILIRGKWSIIATVSFGVPSKYEQNLQSEKSTSIASKSSCV